MTTTPREKPAKWFYLPILLIPLKGIGRLGYYAYAMCNPCLSHLTYPLRVLQKNLIARYLSLSEFLTPQSLFFESRSDPVVIAEEIINLKDSDGLDISEAITQIAHQRRLSNPQSAFVSKVLYEWGFL